MEKAEVVIVAAVAENGVIGKNGTLPWHYPEDLEHFRKLTTGEAVLMGRRTFEDIWSKLDGPLPERLNIVLTRSGLEEEMRGDESVVEANSLEQAEEAVETHGHERLMVAGGASVYRQLLPEADRIELTRIEQSYEGDARFPEIEWEDWEKESSEEAAGGDLVFESYVRSS